MVKSLLPLKHQGHGRVGIVAGLHDFIVLDRAAGEGRHRGGSAVSGVYQQEVIEGIEGAPGLSFFNGAPGAPDIVSPKTPGAVSAPPLHYVLIQNLKPRTQKRF
jgi:hypothetical protein